MGVDFVAFLKMSLFLLGIIYIFSLVVERKYKLAICCLILLAIYPMSMLLIGAIGFVIMIAKSLDC